MRRRVSRILLVLVVPFVAVTAMSGGLLWAWSAHALGAREKTVEGIVEATVAKRAAEGRQVADADLADAGTIRILLLGLDARIDQEHPHCDAIHLFSIDTRRWTVDVTSVPRGTYAYIPKEKLDWEKFDKEALEKRIADAKAKLPAEGVAETPVVPAPTEPAPVVTPEERDKMLEGAFISQESYLANACAFMGLDYGIDKIEKVIGAKHDYLVTVGFSQTVGILRLLNLPGTEALQWLRHRQSYAVGDPQRSHNQATFMKDLVVGQIDRLADPAALPFVRILYAFAHTDMGFETAYALLKGLAGSGLSSHPERITLAMKPAFETKDYHFDPNQPLKGLETFYAGVAKRLSSQDFSSATIEEVQAALVASIDARLASPDPVDDLMDKEIWLQVKDDAQRERIHFALTERTARALAKDGKKEQAVELVTDYVLEKETLGIDASAQKGKALLGELLEPAK